MAAKYVNRYNKESWEFERVSSWVLFSEGGKTFAQRVMQVHGEIKPVSTEVPFEVQIREGKCFYYEDDYVLNCSFPTKEEAEKYAQTVEGGKATLLCTTFTADKNGVSETSKYVVTVPHLTELGIVEDTCNYFFDYEAAELDRRITDARPHEL